LPSRTQLEELLKADPEDVFLQYALAKACVSEGDIDQAVSRFEAVIARDPNYVPAYFQMGQALAENERPDEARAIVARGIDVARAVGDQHAQSEMTAFLETLPEG
jgi:predicted Zn-dependent protease